MSLKDDIDNMLPPPLPPAVPSAPDLPSFDGEINPPEAPATTPAEPPPAPATDTSDESKKSREELKAEAVRRGLVTESSKLGAAKLLALLEGHEEQPSADTERPLPPPDPEDELGRYPSSALARAKALVWTYHQQEAELWCDVYTQELSTSEDEFAATTAKKAVLAFRKFFSNDD